MNAPEPVPIAPAFIGPALDTITNTSKQPRHIVFLDGRIPAQEVERDATRTVLGDYNTPQHPPVLYGPDRRPVAGRNIPLHKATVRQLRELHVDLGPAGSPTASVQVPRSFRSSFYAVRCELCSTPSAGIGCKHVDDPDHLAAWTIVGPKLLCVGWARVEELAAVPVDATYLGSLEQSKTASAANNWGKPKRPAQ